MQCKRSAWFLCMVIFHLSFKAHLSVAADAISRGQPLSGNQTIISKGGNFELGFFRPGKSLGFYIGIWCRTIPDKVIVWVANRATPLANTAESELRISGVGNLVLLARPNVTIWSSNLTSPASNSTTAVLLDSGNFVLRDVRNPSLVLWQSFEHPTNTLLPTQRFGINKVTGEVLALVSWRNLEDPAPGLFSHSIQTDGTDQLLLYRNGSEYWTSGVWNGETYSGLPEWATNFYFKFSHVNNEEGIFISYTPRNERTLSSLVMDVTGQVKIRRWLESTREWLSVSLIPREACTIHSLCGPFSSCNLDAVPSCRCLTGFQPRFPESWDLSDWSGGCVRKVPLQCGNSSFSQGGKGDGFMKMTNVELPIDSKNLSAGGATECEAACYGDCSCTAYSYSEECLVWNGDLLDLKQLSEDTAERAKSRTLYLRLSRSELPGRGRRKHMAFEVIFASVAAGSIICLCIAYVLRKTFCSGNSVRTLNRGISGSLLVFSYRDLATASNNFSEKLGEGGFGIVYKGTLPDSTVVAIKMLKGLKQGEKQFRAEVSTIGMVHHVNLVRLIGLCSQDSHRMLVYEYMPNNSLDSHLFRENTKTLNWRTRFDVALGTARGLDYLHEKCRDCIIHCDVKPENILLDAAGSPKLADFGMAKLVGRDFSRVITTVRGTLGYLAPEWISGQAITSKVDVYSFGMMLFEIISGKRNTDPHEDGDWFFPVWALSRVKDDNVLCLLDKKLEGDCDVEELNRACRVAGWCIQGDETHRPSMGQVVQILEGLLDVNVPPIPSFLQHCVQNMESEVPVLLQPSCPKETT